MEEDPDSSTVAPPMATTSNITPQMLPAMVAAVVVVVPAGLVVLPGWATSTTSPCPTTILASGLEATTTTPRQSQQAPWDSMEVFPLLAAEGTTGT